MSPAAPIVPGGRKTEPRGVIALLLAIVGIFTVLPSVVLGPVSLALAIKAKKNVAESGGALNGAGLAQAGFIMGIVATSLGALVVLFLGFCAVILVGS